MPDVLVTGGTGQLGRELVPRLVTKGYDVRVLSRRANPPVPAGVRAVTGDLVTGAGIEDATAGVDVIVHCASGASTAPVRGLTYRYSKKTDVDATKAMLDAAKRSGSPRVLYISIVGIDRIPLGYYRAKLETERVIEESGLDHAILRTTQWHTLAFEICSRLTRLPIAPAPKGFRVQLLDPSEVADRMVALLEENASGRTPDMGGPQLLSSDEVVRSYLRAAGKSRRIVQMPLPGKTAEAYREGHNWTLDHADGQITWDEWLAKNVASTP